MTAGHRPATVGAVPAPAGAHPSYRGARGCGRTWGQSGGLASAPAHWPQSLPKSPSGLPVYGCRAARGSEEALSSSWPLSRWPAAAIFQALLSFSFHGDPGRQEARQSFRQLCEGKQEAGGREAGQHGRLLPPPRRQQPACRRGSGRPGVETWAAPGASSLIQERKPRPLALVQENTALASGHPMSWEPQARPPSPRAGPSQDSQGPTNRSSTLGPPPGAQWLALLSSPRGTVPVTPLARTRTGRLGHLGKRPCQREGRPPDPTQRACLLAKDPCASRAPAPQPWRPPAREGPRLYAEDSSSSAPAGRRGKYLGPIYTKVLSQDFSISLPLLTPATLRFLIFIFIDQKGRRSQKHQ